MWFHRVLARVVVRLQYCWPLVNHSTPTGSIYPHNTGKIAFADCICQCMISIAPGGLLTTIVCWTSPSPLSFTSPWGHPQKMDGHHKKPYKMLWQCSDHQKAKKNIKVEDWRGRGITTIVQQLRGSPCLVMGFNQDTWTILEGPPPKVWHWLVCSSSTTRYSPL